MKLVIQSHSHTMTEHVHEWQLESIKQQIRQNYPGMEKPPLPFELFRYKTSSGVIIIYKSNRTLRSKNAWYEVRALTALSKELSMEFIQNLRFPYGDSETEVDGVDCEEGAIMVEIKRVEINQEWIDFYEKKRSILKMKACLIIAPLYQEDLRIPKTIECYIFHIDTDATKSYYLEKFRIPDWLSSLMASRHIRALFPNGRWKGLRRQLTATAKHTPTTKLQLFIKNLARRELLPVKLYYSLAEMLMPVDEYYGKGRPLDKIITALDIDADPHSHIIGKSGYCEQCLEKSREKAELVENYLEEHGFNFKRLFSGSKGFHFYLFSDDAYQNPLIMNRSEFAELISSMVSKDGNPLSDNANFCDKDGKFDLHRIFKLPASIDCSNGVVVAEKFTKLSLKDKLRELK